MTGPVDSLPAAIAAALRTQVPGARPDQAEVAGRGWDVTAWRIPADGGDWTARVPRHPGGAQSIEAQTCLAGVLGPHGLPLPRDPSILRDAQGVLLAGLYRYEDGCPAVVRGRAERTRLASMIADFLNVLHAINPAELASCAPRQYEPWADEFAPLVARTVDTLGPATARWVQARASALARASERLPPPVIVHADLKPAHVLLHDTGQISAVLDFESVQVSDPALDFSRLIQHWGQSFAEQVLARYEREVDEGLMERAQVYRDFDELSVIDTAERYDQTRLLPLARRNLRARAAAATRALTP